MMPTYLTRHRFAALPIALASLFLWGSQPAGQQPFAQTRFGQPTLSSDLSQHPAGPHTHRVIVQAADTALDLLRHGLGRGYLRRDLGTALALDVDDAELDALEHNPLYAHISGDLPVAAHAAADYGPAVTNSVTQAASVWQGTSSLLGGTPGYTGAGVGIAIVDSGIAAHTALDTRVVAHVNLVSSDPGGSGDPFGHGTHVAGIAGGNRTAATNVTTAFNGGSAPAVKLVDVRVLGADGSGLTSDVIAGINWAVAHRATYNIRIINLSLGHPVTEPSATDPLCQAVANAVAAGLTVVVSAGNYGLTSTGAPVLGGITSPGNSPLAITVGAIDTKSTVDTSDDVIAPYSSKGPTAYDGAVKPDVVAPGTRITSLVSPNSYIISTYPQWYMGGSGKNAYMRLSGTSMATAVVSGGAALLLNAYPSLSPAQVKMAIQMGAHFVPSAGLVGAGTGTVDFQQSLKFAQNGLVTNVLTTVTGLLGPSSGAAYRDYGTLTDAIYNRTGIKLLGLLDLTWLFQNADTMTPGVLNLLGSSNPLASTGANYVVWGNDIASWSTSYYVVWGNSIETPSGQYVVWGNSDNSASNYVVWGNSVGGGH